MCIAAGRNHDQHAGKHANTQTKSRDRVNYPTSTLQNYLQCWILGLYSIVNTKKNKHTKQAWLLTSGQKKRRQKVCETIITYLIPASFLTSHPNNEWCEFKQTTKKYTFSAKAVLAPSSRQWTYFGFPQKAQYRWFQTKIQFWHKPILTDAAEKSSTHSRRTVKCILGAKSRNVERG